MPLSKKAKETLARLDGDTKLGDIKKLGKQIKTDHELAQELWEEGSHHARLLATLTFDKKQLTEFDLEAIAADLQQVEEEQRNQIGDWLLANQLTKDKRLVALMESWREQPSPVLRRWYWYHQARLRWTGRTPPPDNSAELLSYMESRIENEEPEVQWVMNFCAGWIGVYEPELRARCVKLGKDTKLYQDEPVARNCTPSYLPEFIRIEVEKRA